MFPKRKSLCRGDGGNIIVVIVITKTKATSTRRYRFDDQRFWSVEGEVHSLYILWIRSYVICVYWFVRTETNTTILPTAERKPGTIAVVVAIHCYYCYCSPRAGSDGRCLSNGNECELLSRRSTVLAKSHFRSFRRDRVPNFFLILYWKTL